MGGLVFLLRVFMLHVCCLMYLLLDLLVVLEMGIWMCWLLACSYCGNETNGALEKLEDYSKVQHFSICLRLDMTTITSYYCHYYGYYYFRHWLTQGHHYPLTPQTNHHPCSEVVKTTNRSMGLLYST